MELTVSDKTSVMLQLLQHQLAEIERREGREQKLFEWSTGLLAAAFAAVLALSDRDYPLPHSLCIKILGTLVIAGPVSLFLVRVQRYSQLSIENAKAVERIEECLLIFEGGVYGTTTPYPESWKGSFAKKRSERSTPKYYQAVASLMAVCVILVLWLLL